MKSISELGERRIIELIKSCLEMMPKMAVPFGDDVSAVRFSQNTIAVIKTDMLVGITDVPLGMSLRQAARKAVVMNISDFAAKGVSPTALLVALGLPKSYTEDDVKQISLGLNEGAREYGAYIIGGDTSEASDLVISCSLLGFCGIRTLVKRSTAKPGDVVAVTGEFGKTAAGLKILLEHKIVPKEIENPLVDAVLLPKARLKEGLALANTGALTSSVDSSDGLAWSLNELSVASNVGFRINNIPLASEAVEFARIFEYSPLELGLYGGEEYELVVTVDPKFWNKAKSIIKKLGSQLFRIGTVIAEKKLELKTKKESVTIVPKGWEHFQSKLE